MNIKNIPPGIVQEYKRSPDIHKQNIAKKIQILLYLQERSDRDTATMWDDEQSDEQYSESRNFLLQNKCFEIAFWLSGREIPKLTDSQRESMIGGEDVKIEKAEEKFGFPFWGIVDHNKAARHVFLILGKNEIGYIGFEKNGNGKINFFNYSEDNFVWDSGDRHLFSQDLPELS